MAELNKVVDLEKKIRELSAFHEVGKALTSTLDLNQVTNMVRCGKATSCSDADMNAVTGDRPWGLNNPRWQLFAYGPQSRMVPGTVIESHMYVVVWIGDDSSENDNKPLEDGMAITNPGRGIVELLAHGYGPGGVRRVVAATVSRTQSNGQSGARIISWREVR